MERLQGRLDRNGGLYYYRAELTDYVTDLQLQMEKKLGRNKAKVKLTRAIDGSLVFWINDKVVARERPDVEDATSSDSDDSAPEWDYQYMVQQRKKKRKRSRKGVFSEVVPTPKSKERKITSYFEPNKK